MQDSSHNPARIESGRYTADVLRSGTAEPFWYYIIGRKDSHEIIHMEKFETYEQAMEEAREALARMNVNAAAS